MASILALDSRSTISGTNVCVNTWHIALAGTVTTAEATALMVPFTTFYNAFQTYRSGSNTTVTGTRVLYWQTTWWTPPVGIKGHPGYVPGFFNTAPLIVAATTSSSSGGTGANPQPAQLSAVVSWRTAAAGKRNRGRTFIGNLATAAANNNVLNATFLSTLNTAAAALITNVAAVSVASGAPALSVWSASAAASRPIVSGSATSTWYTQRSRVK